jgi:hypothetical protein
MVTGKLSKMREASARQKAQQEAIDARKNNHPFPVIHVASEGKTCLSHMTWKSELSALNRALN